MMKAQVREYLENLARQDYSPLTIRGQKWALRKFAEARYDVGRFLKRLPKSLHTRNHFLVVVRRFLKFAGREAEADGLGFPRRVECPPLRPPTLEDVRMLLRSRDG